jgi:predicted aspartyl protease
MMADIMFLLNFILRTCFQVMFNFLVDTGATITMLSWNDAKHYGVNIRNLPSGVPFDSIGGRVQAYWLPRCKFTFISNDGLFPLPIGDLRVSDYETVGGRRCPPAFSMLGMDILHEFDIFSDSNNVLLRRK